MGAEGLVAEVADGGVHVAKAGGVAEERAEAFGAGAEIIKGVAVEDAAWFGGMEVGGGE